MAPLEGVRTLGGVWVSNFKEQIICKSDCNYRRPPDFSTLGLDKRGHISPYLLKKTKFTFVYKISFSPFFWQIQMLSLEGSWIENYKLSNLLKFKPLKLNV